MVVLSLSSMQVAFGFVSRKTDFTLVDYGGGPCEAPFVAMAECITSICAHKGEGVEPFGAHKFTKPVRVD